MGYRAILKEHAMPRGDKSKYTPAQKRKARHIEESYEQRGLDEPEAAARAWATVNKQTGGGERSGSGRHTASKLKTRARKDSAHRAVATKRGHSPNRGRMTARRSHHTSA
jgi:plasmid stabilization system protein ParE